MTLISIFMWITCVTVWKNMKETLYKGFFNWKLMKIALFLGKKWQVKFGRKKF